MSTEPLTKKRLVTLVAGLFILLGLSWFRLSQSPIDETSGWYELRGETMGTTYVVKFFTEDPALVSTVGKDVELALDMVNQHMSTYRPDSELSQFNLSDTEPRALSAQLFHVMQTALTVSEETGGAYDITVGPIVNAYGFGPEVRVEFPSDEELAPLQALVGREHLTLDEEAKTLRKDIAEVYCDLSSIAKGYGVDVIVEKALSPFENFFVEVGGEVRCQGVNPDGVPWRVAIEKPIEGVRSIYAVVSLQDQAMATSGNYRNFVYKEDQRIPHTIDPRSGRAVEQDLVSATVLHETCELADAYATALMVLGEEEGLAFAEEKGLAVLLLVLESDGSFREVRSSTFTAAK